MLLSARPSPTHLASSLRYLHGSSALSHLVAPPDPVSHMRPIIYDGGAPAPQSPNARIHHPYSLYEFPLEDVRGSKPLQLQYSLQRQQLDEFNHSFWFDSNSRFEAAKQATLATLPPSATPLDKEHALSKFYTHWYMQEVSHTNLYTSEFRHRNFALIKLAARTRYYKLFEHISNIFSPLRSAPQAKPITKPPYNAYHT